MNKHAPKIGTTIWLVQAEAIQNARSIATTELRRSGHEVHAPGNVELGKHNTPLLQWLSAVCLDSIVCSGYLQVLSEAEKDHFVATVKRTWGTQYMCLTEIQLEAGLGHVIGGTIFNALHSSRIWTNVEKNKFSQDKDDQKRTVITGISLSRPCCLKFMPMVVTIVATGNRMECWWQVEKC